MPYLSDVARRISEDAGRSGFRLGEKGTRRLIGLIESMATEIELLVAESKERRAGYPGYE